jgi:hypothetical protein
MGYGGCLATARTQTHPRCPTARVSLPSGSSGGRPPPLGLASRMDHDDLRRIGGAAKQSAFRLETLSQYLVPQEAGELADWKAGKADAAAYSREPRGAGTHPA